MPAVTQGQTDPVQDSVPFVDDNVAVGEDLEFQRKWWKFERAIWIFFFLILTCDVIGLFGRGYLAKAQRTDSTQLLTLEYERFERASTPSIMSLHFSSAAVHDGRVQVFFSESIIRKLGAQRISPQPVLSTLVPGGIVYTFPAAQGPVTVEVALSPSFPGRQHFSIQAAGGQPIDESVTVFP